MAGRAAQSAATALAAATRRPEPGGRQQAPAVGSGARPAGSVGPRRPELSGRGGIGPAVRLIERHGDELVATARRYSLSPQDAEDAYQRALEVLLRRSPALAHEELLPWMKKVVRHEAFAIWRERRRVALPGDDELEQVRGPGPEPQEQLERYEQLRHGAEAIRRLKPQEVRALALRAEGLTYRQIAELTGWSWTKVNRRLTEGRRSFRRRVAAIESGAECDRLAPLLSVLADGEASPQQQSELRPHLGSCLSCRAALRAFRELPHRAAEVVPLAAAGGGEGLHAALWRWGESVVGWFQERAALAGMKVQAAAEGASANKVAAVAASTAALAGGTIAVGVLGGGGERPASKPERREAPAERMTPPFLPSDPARAAASTAPDVSGAPAAPPVPVPAPSPLSSSPPPARISVPTSPAPMDSATELSERPVPRSLTVPVEGGGDSALPGVDESERTIDPMTTPVGRGGGNSSGSQSGAPPDETSDTQQAPTQDGAVGPPSE